MDRRRIGGVALDVLQEPKRIKRESGNRRILHLDVTIEILSFLPAKSLVRFRRVCKLWFSITHNPHFIQTHLRKVHAPTILLIPYFIGMLTITRLDCCADPSARLNPKHVIPDRDDVLIYASCNGLLCLSHSGATTTLVVNPATGDSLTLPPSTHSCSITFRPHMYYFGFEPATKKYKVLGTFTDKDALVCQVFTLGTDSAWRQIHVPLDLRTFRLYGLALKGAIYWRGVGPGDRALRFNLKDECFDQITLPSFKIFYRGRNYDISRDFTELQGSLCLPVFPDIIMSDPPIMLRMDIWAMTSSSSNTKHDWSIKYSIMFPWDRCCHPTPLLIINDKILIHDHQHGPRLQYHDLRPNSNGGGDNRYTEVFHQDEDLYRMSFVYVESLVPLPR